MGIKSIAAATITLILSTNLNAALVGINDAQMAFLGVPQDGFNITRDTSNGLDWLDWSLTVGRSYSDVFAETQGGNLDGWRYATATEFEMLATEAGIPSTFFDATPGGTHPGFVTLNGHLGSGSIDGESVAISAHSHLAGTHAIGGFSSLQDAFEVPDPQPVAYDPAWLDSATSDRLGHALVREVETVSVPAAVWLFGSGLLCLIGVARREVPV